MIKGVSAHAVVQRARSLGGDLSSSRTGSTVFDLNGDGKVEVLYGDELNLRVYDGTNGNPLYTIPNSSGTLWEYPVVADVDGDGSADIVAVAPSAALNGVMTNPMVPSNVGGGVRVFSSPAAGGKWVSTRPLWNQYTYYPEIVGNNLRTTVGASPSQGFRVNSQGTLPSGLNTLLPDLAIIAPHFPDKDHPQRLTFYVMNLGEADSVGQPVVQVTRNGTVIGSTGLSNVIVAGGGISVKVDLNSLVTPSDQLTARVGLSASVSDFPTMPTDSCGQHDTNNSVNFSLLGIARTTN